MCVSACERERIGNETNPAGLGAALPTRQPSFVVPYLVFSNVLVDKLGRFGDSFFDGSTHGCRLLSLICSSVIGAEWNFTLGS